MTAFTQEDALALVRQRLFDGELPAIEQIVVGVDVSTLDERHVLPNMGVAVNRGVWLPRT